MAWSAPLRGQLKPRVGRRRGNEKMKKRLRKKTHQGEFLQSGAPLNIVRAQADGFDDFLDDFLEHGVEANDCLFAGGGNYMQLAGVVELGRMVDDHEGRLDLATKWLDSRRDVKRYDVGDLVDLWHGPFDFMDSWRQEQANAADGY